MESAEIFSINQRAREYVNNRFPKATHLEREKIVNDWVRKVDV